MENYNKNKSTPEYFADQIEPDTLALYGKDMNDQQEVQSQDIHIYDNQATTFYNERTTDPQKGTNKEDKIQSEFEMMQINPNAQEVFEQGQVFQPMEVAASNTTTEIVMQSNRILENTSIEQHLVIKNIVTDIEPHLTPIIEYANEPMLPLFKACDPLTDIVHNISFYVQLALKETPEQPPDGLTIDESAAVRLYTIEWQRPHRGLYSMLNHTLKYDNREKLRPYFKYLKLFLSGLVKIPCIPQLTVWRGVTKDFSSQFPPDTEVTWWAFSSCTKTLTVLENNMYLGVTGSRTLFSVDAINARSIRAHSHFATEDEILLLPGTRMVVQSQLSPAPDLHIIHLKQEVPDVVLLKPPFEGNFNNIHSMFKSISFSIQVQLFIPKQRKSHVTLSSFCSMIK